MAPISAWRYNSPRSATTGAAALCTLIRLSPEDDVYLKMVKKYKTAFNSHQMQAAKGRNQINKMNFHYDLETMEQAS